MKITGKEMGKLIRHVVREEVELLLPKLMEEILTEKYIRKIIAESAVRSDKRKISLSEITTQDDPSEREEDEVPGPISNDDDGIFQKNPLVKESVLMSNDNPLASLYEGVKPIALGDGTSGAQQSEVPEVPDAFIKQLDTRKMDMIMESKVSRRPMQKSIEAMERDLELKRKALEVPVK